jgi:Mannosylglycerate hydrolase MGH1-like glycoside hydrolase domain
VAAQRTRWAIWSGLGLAALLAAVIYWQWRPTSAPVGPLPESPLSIKSKPFAAWMRFESVAEHRDLFERLYIDLILGHQVFKVLPRGLPPQRAQALFLDDDELLLSSGRRLWTREALAVPGLVGKFCYIHSNFCLRRLFETSFEVDGEPQVIYDNQYTIERYPSRTVIHYVLGGVQIDENKYITYDDRAVCTYEALTRDGRPHAVAVHVISENLTMPNSEGVTRYPLLGAGKYQGQPLYVYLDAPGFEKVDGYPINLRQTVNVVPNGKPPRVTVAVSFETGRRSHPSEALPPDILERHVEDYQQWFADNVPYFDCPDGAIKKMWYYRWWVVRFNLAEPNTDDLKGYAFYEGRLGFDNLISFAVPAQLEELAFLRDPRFGLGQAENSFHNLSSIGALMDAPGSPYWGEMYSQWTAGALADFNRVHPIDPATLRELLPSMASDVRAWMGAFDPDGDFLPSRDIPRITGYDLDILSWWYFNGLKLDLFAKPAAEERVDFASFVYANAAAVAELADVAGDRALTQEFSTLAGKIRSAVLQKLWDPQSQFFYPQRASDDRRIPIRELHGFFPITMRLVPDDPTYLAALRKFIDPNEFWARFPPVIVSLVHYRQWTWDMNGLTRNIAPHPISMGGLTLIRALHDYHQDIVSPGDFMELMRRYTALMYPGVYPNDPTWRPNAHEYYSHWEPGSSSLLPEPSKISHDFHSMYNALVVQGMVGLTPRRDDRIELRPAAREWAYFALDRLRYHGHDLTIVWDRPNDGQRRYPEYPEGFSLYIDGQHVFTRATLDPVIYDPATHGATEIKG